MSPIDTHHALHAQMLGTPLHEERTCPDGVGRYRTYESGSIHWHPDTGSHFTTGAIREMWRKLGWENGSLGYPTSDEYPLSEKGARELTTPGGNIPEYRYTLEGLKIDCGYGTDPIYSQAQNYQNGLIYWIRSENRCVVLRKNPPTSRDYGWTPRYSQVIA